ncbi:transcriptional regulator with XRE-family HTH domain [Bartonella silvatica]|uniref:Transcriptional regulator with XRE-family HTH domain n=1 Tax=Bartonella silvatica TaxID=357760 RepID=A0ABV2HHY0_9HYPH
MQTKSPHFNDISVSKKIRFKRNTMGLSQKQLGSHLGVTFQQIQKYENGVNRMSAGRLQEIASILNTPIAFFYANISTKEDTSDHHDDRISTKAEYLLLKSFRELKPVKQKAILQLISDESVP